MNRRVVMPKKTDRTRLRLPSSPLQVLLNLLLNPLGWRKSPFKRCRGKRVGKRQG